MRLSHVAALALTMILSTAPLTRADAFDPHRVPATAKWVVHVDMDILQKSKAWDTVERQLEANFSFQQGIQQVSLVGPQFPNDFHDVTIYGDSGDETSPVIIFNVNFDQEKLVNFLKLSPTYASSTYGDHEIHAWQDNNGKQLYGAFTSKGLTILGQSLKNIQATLDTLDAKADCVPADSVIVGGAKPGVVALIGGQDLSELNKNIKKNPFLHQVKSGWLALSVEGDDLAMESNLIAKNAIAAEQIRAAMEGIKAGVTLASADPDAPIKTKLAAIALANVTTKTHDKTVTVQGKMSIDAASKLITDLNAAATQPATTAPDNN